MKLAFYGAAGTVTGSRYLLSNDDTRVLIDTGLFQGKVRARNWEDPPFDIESLTAIVLTHAHIDHSGYLPLLVKRGYRGPVYCTAATAELCGILLPDSGYLQEEEAHYMNKHKMSRHDPALPLYTQAEAEASLKYLKPVPFDSKVDIGGGFSFRYLPAGHILGAASVHFDAGGQRVVFSGDVGRMDGPIMNAPVPFEHADYLVCESTYGNRLHEDTDPYQQLAEIVRETMAQSGVVLIPAFAVGRAQTIMHFVAKAITQGDIPDCPVYLNSPMAINATEIYCRYHDEHRLSEAECMQMGAEVEFVRSTKASRALNDNMGPAVIISASGMATGGRVVHHLKRLLPDPRNVVLFAGFQAPGTRGDALVNGADSVVIHGEEIPVRAQVIDLEGLSAHGDYSELLDWLGHVKSPPKKTFVTHGEPDAAAAFVGHIKDVLGWKAEVPGYKDVVELS